LRGKSWLRRVHLHLTRISLALRLSFRLGPNVPAPRHCLDRSAARYTCYAQRNGPASGVIDNLSLTCPLHLGTRARDANVSVTRPVRDTLHLLRSAGRSTTPTASQVRFLASQADAPVMGSREPMATEDPPTAKTRVHQAGSDLRALAIFGHPSGPPTSLGGRAS
jgi:hypothetical protein